MAMLALLVSIAFTGCSDSPTAQPVPGVQPEIINIADSFEYQIQSIANYTGSASYSWQNSGNTAVVDHSSAITDGVGTLVILDADGTEVYAGVLTDSGSVATQAGTPGTWTVRISYVTFSGTVNFRVQTAV